MANVTLTQGEGGRVVNMSPGEEIVVRLEENPTTGYRWVLSGSDENVLQLISSEYKSASSGIGGGGERVMTFRAAQAGTSTLRLKSSREWEPESPQATFDVTVNVAA